MPAIIIQIDGKNFTEFTKGLRTPYDGILMESMQQTMRYLCERVDDCVLGYANGDNISIVITYKYPYINECSLIASIATLAFNKFFRKNAEGYMSNIGNYALSSDCVDINDISNYCDSLVRCIEDGAIFRVGYAKLSADEVAYYLYFNQVDSMGNYIRGTSNSTFDNSELEGLNLTGIREVFNSNGIDFDSVNPVLKLGSCCVKDDSGNWMIDRSIPVFDDAGAEYIVSRVK